MTKLHILEGSCKGQSFDLKGDVIFIGRAPDNGIQIKDKTVSRVHLQLIRKENEYYVRDLKSTNGTFVNGEKVTSGAEIRIYEGIPVNIGRSVICLGEECLEYFQPILDSNELSEEKRQLTSQKNMQLMDDVFNLLTESLGINDLFSKILDHFLKVFKRIDRGIIIAVDENKAISKEVYRIRNGSRINSIFYSLDVVKRVIKEMRPIIISDVYADDDNGLSDTLKIIKIGSVMCVPLISNSHLWGVIYIDAVEKAHGFREEDLDLLTALCEPLAYAIENISLNLSNDKITNNIEETSPVDYRNKFGCTEISHTLENRNFVCD